MGGLPSLVESLAAHAVQSGFVPPLFDSNNGSEPIRMAETSTAENQKMDASNSRVEVSDEPMDTERLEPERVTQRTSAEGSSDSHPSVVDAAGPDERPDVSTVDMELMEEAGMIFRGRN